MPIETLINAFAIPGAALLVWCLALWTPWSAKRWGGDADESARRARRLVPLALTAIGAGVAFAFSHRAIDGRWPDVPPTLTTNVTAWLFWLGLLAALASMCDALLARKPWVRWAVRFFACAIVGAVPVLLLMQGESSWYSGEFAPGQKSGPMWIVAGTIVALLSWAAFTPKRDDEERLHRIVPLGVYTGLLAPTMVMWSVAINAQVLGAASLVLAAAGVVTLWRPRARAYDAVAGFAVLVAVATMTGTYHFADEYPPPASAILAAGAPLALFLTRLRVFRPKGRYRRTIVATILVGVPISAALSVGVWDYFKLGESPDAHSGGTSQEELWYGD